MRGSVGMSMRVETFVIDWLRNCLHFYFFGRWKNLVVCAIVFNGLFEILNTTIEIALLPQPDFMIRRLLIIYPWNAFSHTCFSSRSLFADKQVTKYLVRLRNELSTSNVRWSRDERCNINDITKNPRFCKKKKTKMKLCHFVCTFYQIKLSQFTWIICCCTVCELSTNSQIKPNNFELHIR